MNGEGLSILTRQPWPALNQTSQLGVGVTHIGPKTLRFLRARVVRFRGKPQPQGGGFFVALPSDLRSEDERFLCYGAVQSSTTSPVTLENSRTLFVTSVTPKLRAWAAIMVSKGPMGVPRDSNCVRSVP